MRPYLSLLLGIIFYPTASPSQTFILAIKKIDTITVGADSRMLIDSVYELDGKEAHITVPDTKCKIRMGDRLSFAVAPIF